MQWMRLIFTLMRKKTEFDLRPGFLNAAAIFLEKYKKYKNNIILSQDQSYRIGSYPYNQLIINLTHLNILKQSNESYKILDWHKHDQLSEKQNIFLKYIETQSPYWKIGFIDGLDHFKNPDSNDKKNIYQCMEEVGLFSLPLSTQANYLHFRIIDLVRSDSYDPSSLKKMQLGREGEQMTLMYEFNKTNVLPLHKSSYNNHAGYDVKSYYPENIVKHIEVKTSGTNFNQAHITLREWEVALNKIKQKELYEFHFWKKIGEKWSLAIIHPDDLSFMGNPKRNSHHWPEYIVKFFPFKDKFREIQSTQLKKIYDE